MQTLIDEKLLQPAAAGDVIAVLPLTKQMLNGLLECLELSLIAAADRRRGLAAAELTTVLKNSIRQLSDDDTDETPADSDGE